MLERRIGNIFNENAQALVNPVNTEGVMGKGLAYQFKKKYPKNFDEYKARCDNDEFFIGSDLVYTVEEDDKYIIDLPTKEKWRRPSKISYIQVGLKKLEELIIKNSIESIAIPPLGAGNGGLNWTEVEEEIIKFSELESLKNCKIIIYEPNEDIFHLTKSHLYLTKIILELNKKELKNYISDLNFQKIFYLLDISWNKNYFKFQKEKKGPFSKTLNILYGQLKQYRNIKKKKLGEIEKELEKKYIGNQLLEENKKIKEIVSLISSFIDYFKVKDEKELEFHLELATTLIFIIKEGEKIDLENLKRKLFTWNERKKDRFNEENIESSIEFLRKMKIISQDLFGNYSI